MYNQIYCKFKLSNYINEFYVVAWISLFKKLNYWISKWEK